MRAGIVFGVMVLATPAWAQPSLTSRSGSQVSAEVVERYQQLQAMEQVLEEAVTRGVRAVEQQLPAVPGLVFFAGQVRVRGFDLDEYGLFFDVEYPVVRRSILWSMSMLQLNSGMSRVLEDLRRRVQTMPEGPGQLAFGEAIAEMAAELERTSPISRATSRVNAGDADVDPRQGQDTVSIDPAAAYVTALTGELTSAMVSYGSNLALTGDQWLSVAARDGRGQVDPRVTGLPQTLKLRVRGRDLVSLREGRLSAEELRQRVEAP